MARDFVLSICLFSFLAEVSILVLLVESGKLKVESVGRETLFVNRCWLIVVRVKVSIINYALKKGA
jgi:hypothetical protein